MENINCPLCGSNDVNVIDLTDRLDNGHTYKCNRCFHYILSENVENMIKDYKIRNAIYNFLYDNYSMNNEYYLFFNDHKKYKETDKQISINQIMRNYPKNILEKMDKALLNISKKKKYVGDFIVTENLDCALFYCESVYSQKEEKRTIIKSLIELNYLKAKYMVNTYEITLNGWMRIEKLIKEFNELNQGFAAMRFGEETKEISNTFRKAIESCGYNFVRIDQKDIIIKLYLKYSLKLKEASLWSLM